jgi:hypothetical protein
VGNDSSSYEFQNTFGALNEIVKFSASSAGHQNAYGEQGGDWRRHDEDKQSSYGKIQFNPSYEMNFSDQSGAWVPDNRSAGIFSDPDLIFAFSDSLGLQSDPGTMFTGSSITASGDAARALEIVQQIRSSPYGLLGNPYAKLPEKLAQHLHQYVMGDTQKALNAVIAELQKGDAADLALAGRLFYEAMDTAITSLEQMPDATDEHEGVSLVEDQYGRFSFEGTKFLPSARQDPEYVAYREQIARRRQDLARAHGASRGANVSTPGEMPLGSYAPIAELYAAQDPADIAYRQGQTPATKRGAAVYTDTSGYIGAHAGEQGGQRSQTALEKFYEEQGA